MISCEKGYDILFITWPWGCHNLSYMILKSKSWDAIFFFKERFLSFKVFNGKVKL